MLIYIAQSTKKLMENSFRGVTKSSDLASAVFGIEKLSNIFRRQRTDRPPPYDQYILELSFNY